MSGFQGRRVIVTGATGFIGTRLCARLVDAGAEVHALSRRVTPETNGSIQWHRGDLADADAIQAFVRSVAPDTVFHLASQVSGKPGRELVRPMLESNLLGTVNLLAGVQEAGCRRVVVTGTVVEPCDDEPATSPYAAAKAAATNYARMFHALYGTPVVCLRLSMVYGPGQADPHKLIPYVIGTLLRGEAPRVSNGAWEVDWVYVDDVVQALLMAADAEGGDGHTLDVASGDRASVRGVVERLADMIEVGGEPRFGAIADRPPEPCVSSDLERTHDVLGWSAATSLSDGLSRTIKWFRESLPCTLVPLMFLARDAGAGAL